MGMGLGNCGDLLGGVAEFLHHSLTLEPIPLTMSLTEKHHVLVLVFAAKPRKGMQVCGI